VPTDREDVAKAIPNVLGDDGPFFFFFSLPDIFRVVISQKLMCGRIFANGQITKDIDNC
jgi:hypothetical protein